MLNQAFLFDSFNAYYEQAEAEREKGDVVAAQRFYKLASQAMLKLAQSSEGELKRTRVARAERLISKANSLAHAPSVINGNHRQLSATPPEEGSTIFAPVTVPDIGFDDVAGLDDVKESIYTRIINPRKHPQVYRTFKKNAGGGLLLPGPPGTGKTMIAKAIAKEVDAKFYSIRCSDLLCKYYGQAEKNIKTLFETAGKDEASIIFMDEFEGLGSHRGGSSSVMNRVVTELLSQIDGFSKSDNMILLLAATNRPWDIDSAFLRPGRFNEILYIPLPDHDARKHIIKKSYEGVPIELDICFSTLADFMEGYNGADVVEFCDRSKDYAIKRCIQNGGIIGNEMVTETDINVCKEIFMSSVQTQDLAAFERFMKQYQ
jgi:transitional endoplasmic reticulum ATPase